MSEDISVMAKAQRDALPADLSLPSTIISTTEPLSAVPPAISVRDRLTLLLGRNKLAISMEVALVLGLLYAFEFLSIGFIFPLLLLITSLYWLRKTSWRTVGLAQPKHVWRTVLYGIGAACAILLLQSFVIIPGLLVILGQQPNLQSFSLLQGNLPQLLNALVMAWTSAGFGEEALFRGYLFNRLSDLCGKSKVGWSAALLGQAIVFGSIHAYQGIAGVIGAILFGLLAGLLYLANKRNLWVTVIAHGLIDTVSFLLISTGF